MISLEIFSMLLNRLSEIVSKELNIEDFYGYAIYNE
jgi:hypothetical protein